MTTNDDFMDIQLGLLELEREGTLGTLIIESVKEVHKMVKEKEDLSKDVNIQFPRYDLEILRGISMRLKKNHNIKAKPTDLLEIYLNKGLSNITGVNIKLVRYEKKEE